MEKLNKKTNILLMIISVLIAALFISCDSYNNLKKEVDYYKQQADSCFWKEYAEKADAYIDAIYECDCDCIYDVAMEGDAYSEYIEYYERVHKERDK